MATATDRRREAGFATLEALVASGFVFAFVTAGIATSYFAFARAWLDRSAYEGSICLATDASRFACERELRAALVRALPFGSLNQLSVERSPSFVEVRGVWSISSAMSLRFEDRRTLPLRGVK